MRNRIALLSLSILSVATLLPANPPSPHGDRPSPPPRPSELAKFVVEDFDANGNETIDIKELEIALVAIHEMRPRRRDRGDGETDERGPKPPPFDELFVSKDANGDSELVELELVSLFETLERLHKTANGDGSARRGPSPHDGVSRK